MNELRPESGYRDNAIEIALLLLTIAALLPRIFVPSILLNLFVDYTSEGGIFLVKFHLAAYAIIFVLLLALFSRPFFLNRADFSLFKTFIAVSGMLVVLTALIVVVNGFGITGLIIDTYLIAVLAGLLLLTQTRDARYIVGTVIIATMVLSALIGIGEVIVQKRLLPFVEGELVFRPTGLAGHPLALGAHIVLVIGFVSLTRWSVWLKVLLTFVLFIGLAASGARLAMIAGAVEILMLLCFSQWQGLSRRRERQAKLMTVLFACALGGALLLTLSVGGFLDRFSNTLVDDSSMARIKIYQIFSYVSWRDILMGMDANNLLAIVRKELDLPFIESAPVTLILTLGLPAALAFAVILIILFTRLLTGAPVQAKIAVLVFIIVDLSNNGLATKNPDIILLTVLVVAFRSSPPQTTAALEERERRSQRVLSTTSSRPERFRV